jgi:hypothetical protein
MASFFLKLSLKSQPDVDSGYHLGGFRHWETFVGFEDSLEYFFALGPEPGKTGCVISMWDIASSGLTL